MPTTRKRKPTRGKRRTRKRIQKRTLWIGLGICLAAVAALTAVGIALLRPPAETRHTSAPVPTPVPTPAPWLANIDKTVTPSIHLAWEYMPLTLDEVPEGINVLSPVWFDVIEDEDGQTTVQSPHEAGKARWDPEQYVQKAKEGNAQVWPSIASFTPELSKNVVSDPECQSKLIDKLCGWVEEYGFDGLCLDFENMDPADKEKYTAFAAALRKKLPPGATLAVAVTVPVVSENPSNWWQCYDRKGLAQVCDYIAMMAYDQHRGAEPYTPVAGSAWVERKLQLLLSEITSGKVLLGIPFYGVEYVETPGSDEPPESNVVGPDVVARLETQGEYTTIAGTEYTLGEWVEKGIWDKNHRMTVYTFTDTEGGIHTLYSEDRSSLASKASLAQEYHVAGAAVWQKSFGTPGLWSALREEFK